MSELSDKTFAIIASKDIRADDVDIKAGEQVACITSAVRPMTLFGLLQFHGFACEEVTTVPGTDGDETEVDTDGEPGGDSQPDGSEDVGQGDESDDEPQGDAAGDGDADDADEKQAAHDAFVADGLDEKTAKILAEQGLTPTSLKELIAGDIDLVDLEGIGETRAEKILKVYPKA